MPTVLLFQRRSTRVKLPHFFRTELLVELQAELLQAKPLAERLAGLEAERRPKKGKKVERGRKQVCLR